MFGRGSFAFDSVHKEIGIYQAQFIFFFRLYHDEYDIRFARLGTDPGSLGLQSKNKIPCETESAFAVFPAGIP